MHALHAELHAACRDREDVERRAIAHEQELSLDLARQQERYRAKVPFDDTAVPHLSGMNVPSFDRTSVQRKVCVCRGVVCL